MITKKILRLALIFGIFLFNSSFLSYNKINRHVAFNKCAKVYITFKLKKGERYIFNYTNEFFEAKTLMFSNPGNDDTIITKTINTDVAISIASMFGIQTKSGVVREVKYQLLANPGDTLHLAIMHNFLLDLSECKKENVLADSTLIYYSDNSFLEGKTSLQTDNDKWIKFYSIYTNQYELEIKRIDELFENKRVDSVFYHQLIVNCNLHYYTRLFDWLFKANGTYFKPAADTLTHRTGAIEKLLQDKDTFLSNEVLTVADGLVRLKLISNRIDFTIDENVYREALLMNIGKYKTSYLTVSIAHAISKNSPDLHWILIDYRRRVKDEKYNKYIDSLLGGRLTGKLIATKDTIISLSNTPTSWNNICRSHTHFIMVDFWASWCIPCRQQLPMMDSIKKIVRNYPVEFISVNLDDNPENWRAASKAEIIHLNANNYHLLNGHKSNLVRQLCINSIPRYVLLKNSKIVAADFYQPTDPSFVNELLKIIKTNN